jgi:acid stress-induced BolA-like protein IbaG/YrbA
MVTPGDIKNWIESGLKDAHVEIDGDGHHFNAVIVTPLFEGKSRIAQHQLVYAALGDKMKAEIHALSMRTLTPKEWQQEHGA